MDNSEKKSMLAFFGVLVTALLVILISIIGLDIPAAAVCVIAVIEIALSFCLQDVPIWLHGLVVIAQIAAGVLCHNIVFIALCAVIYLIGILTLRFMRD